MLNAIIVGPSTALEESIMSPSAEYYDLCNEDAFDLTGQIFRALLDDNQVSSFCATVPPHLSEASVAHWDGMELW